jgi:hypothetical protein
MYLEDKPSEDVFLKNGNLPFPEGEGKLSLEEQRIIVLCVSCRKVCLVSLLDLPEIML